MTQIILAGVSTPSYTIPDLTDEVLPHGNASLRVSVTGFWSNPITIYVRRDNAGIWDVEVSHSAGGVDANFDPLQSEARFAHAILRAVEHATTIKALWAQLESGYEKARADWRAAQEAAQAELKAKLAADPELGVHRATNMLEAALQHVKQAGPYSTFSIKALHRGEDHGTLLTFKTRYGKRATISVGATTISQQKAFEMLAASSHRTTLGL